VLRTNATALCFRRVAKPSAKTGGSPHLIQNYGARKGSHHRQDLPDPFAQHGELVARLGFVKCSWVLPLSIRSDCSTTKPVAKVDWIETRWFEHQRPRPETFHLADTATSASRADGDRGQLARTPGLDAQEVKVYDQLDR